MRQKHLNTFTGVMDQDTDPQFVKPGDYIDAVNLISGISGGKQNLESVKGMVQIDNSGADWPGSGDNYPIGAVEDKQTGTLYFFLYNEDDADKNYIFKFSDLQSDAYENQLVMKTPLFGFTRELRVQGAVVDGKYLYWTNGRAKRDGLTTESNIEGTFPCKINTVKAIRDNNFMESILIPEQLFNQEAATIFTSGNEYGFLLYDDEGAVVTTLTLTSDGTYENDPAAGIAWIKTELEASSLDDYITVEDCGGCELKLASKFYNYQLVVDISDGDLIHVPTGYYPDDIEEYHFRLLKEPPRCAPTTSFVKNTDTAINNVQRNCFQFRVRYIYDDGEHSAWGPISNLALNLGIEGLPVDDLNAIDINFTDEWLSDPSRLCMIAQVEIAVRDGNDSVWKSIKTLDRCELGILSQVYRWSNEQQYGTLPSDDGSQGTGDTQVLKLFDEVPLITAGLAVSAGTDGDQRLYLGDNLEGFDCPDCVDVDFTVETFTETGLIDIIGTVRTLDDIGGSPGNPNYHEPFFPLGGFVVYLAGTPYYGISNNPVDGSGDGSFRIKAVPKGRYILRVAGWQCWFNNDFGTRHNLNNGLEWQRTSSPVLDCAGSTAATGIETERVVDLTAFSGTEFDLDTETGYGTIDILHGFSDDNTKLLIELYALDGAEDLAYVNGNADDYDAFCGKVLAAISVERIQLTFADGISSPQNRYADHNGYAYFISEATDPALDFGSVGMDDFVHSQSSPFVWKIIDDTTGNLDNSVSGVGQLVSDTTILYTTQIVMLNSSATWSTTYRRLLTGRVIDDDGNGVSGVLVMYERNGRQEVTDPFGYYSIAIYPPNAGSAAARDDDNVYITYPNDISYAYPPTDGFHLADIDPWADYEVPDLGGFPFIGGLAVSGRYLKNGAQYKMGIVYGAIGNQTCGAVPLDSVKIPFCTEDGEIIKHRVKFTINSQPPEWATHYWLVRTKNLVHYRYFQWVTDEVLFATIDNPAATPTFIDFTAATWDYIFIRVNSKDVDGSEAALLLFSREQKEGYTPLTGDRVRFMMDEESFPVGVDKILELSVAGRYIDGENYYVVIPRVEFNSGQVPGPGWSFEFFTPKGVEEPFYYETGDCYEVLNPGAIDRAHAAPDQDQVAGADPAIGYLTGGDTYWRYKSFNTVGPGVRFPTENQTVSPYHQDACEDIGRAFIEAPNDRLWRYNRIRFSNLYIQDSKINGLSSFGADNYQDLNRQFGPIVNLTYVSGVLLTLCWHKAQSMYLKRGQFIDMRGSTTVGRSDQVVNLADESRSENGCQHPESVATDGTRVYWWDAYRGTVCRYSQAGVEPIVRGLYTAFQELSTERKKLAIEDNLVFGGFDRKANLFLLTFPAATYIGDEVVNLDPVTYAFSESADGWKTRFSFYPECYAALGNDLFSLDDTGLYRHHASSLYNHFYGLYYDSEVKYVANPAPGRIKDWHCLALRTDERWEAPVIELPHNLNYGEGMLSRLKPSRFSSYEGDLCADFMGDMNDTDAEFTAIVDTATRQKTALLRGRLLKGPYMVVKLVSALDESEHDGNQVKIWHVVTDYSESMSTGM